jgi:hypothetical protein
MIHASGGADGIIRLFGAKTEGGAQRATPESAS